MAPFFTRQEMERDLEAIRGYIPHGFRVVPKFFTLTLDRFLETCNGSGPASAPRWSCRFLTDIESEGARLASIAHDIGFCIGDRSRHAFDVVNHDLRTNIRVVGDVKFHDDLAKREACRVESLAQYIAVSLAGWDAWKASPVLPELADVHV